MGTRSTTQVKQNGRILVTLYCQYDGYPLGVGADLVKVMLSGRLTNGIPLQDPADPNPVRYFNGAGCFAAALIGDLKKAAGLWYVVAADAAKGEEYHYEIDVRVPLTGAPMQFRFRAWESGYRPKLIFDGRPDLYEAHIARIKAR